MNNKLQITQLYNNLTFHNVESKTKIKIISNIANKQDFETKNFVYLRYRERTRRRDLVSKSCSMPIHMTSVVPPFLNA
jgi:hypothetical protein